MKPAGLVARRGDYIVSPAPHRQLVALVREHHYARGAANTSVHAHGLVRAADGELVGAALWMPPTVKAARSIASHATKFGRVIAWTEILSLSRLAVAPGEPQNATGILLSRSMRLVQRDPRWALAVTYADTARGHAGTIYKATNWVEDGTRKTRARWFDSTGRQVAQKATRTRSIGEMLALGFRQEPPASVIRFLYWLRRGP